MSRTKIAALVSFFTLFLFAGLALAQADHSKLDSANALFEAGKFEQAQAGLRRGGCG